MRSAAAARNALDRFHRGSHCLGIRLRPAKAPGVALKEIFNLPGSDRLVVQWIVLLWLTRILLRPERVWILLGHGHLIAAIVGEFAA